MDEQGADIVDPVTGEVVNHCCGPTPQGGCSAPDKNGIVLCAGCRIASLCAGPECWNLWVPPTSQHCPAAWSLDSIGY
jgi:hypothetical protein